MSNGIVISGGYYLNNFFNENFFENIDGLGEVKPYENITANRFEISIGFTSKFWKKVLGEE